MEGKWRSLDSGRGGPDIFGEKEGERAREKESECVFEGKDILSFFQTIDNKNIFHFFPPATWKDKVSTREVTLAIIV